MSSEEASGGEEIEFFDEFSESDTSDDGIPEEEELYELCESESLSVEGLHEIIERYGLTPDNTHHINDYKLILAACENERVTEGIIKCLLEYFPDAANAIDEDGNVPLYYACKNKSATIGKIIQILVDAAPDSIRSKDIEGWTPLHNLCNSDSDMDEAAAIKILKLLIEKFPEAVRHAEDTCGDLPIHIAAGRKSPEFCRVLIEAHPGSEQIGNANGALPLHLACRNNTVATVEYLYRQRPEAINQTEEEGLYPIHYAIDKPAAATVENLRFLLDCDPNQKLKQFHGQSLLQHACERHYNETNIEAGIQIIKNIYDAHPDSVRSEDDNGWMPLHNLCHDSKVDTSAAIQILKLLIEKCPEAVRHADNDGDLPIHFAAVTKSPEFCRVLIEAHPGSEQIGNANGLLPLHFACRNNTVATVEYLYRQRPEAINHTEEEGFYPIHYAIDMDNRDKPAAAVEILRFLLNCDPNQKLKQFHGKSLLHHVCECHSNETNIEAGIQMIKIIFDAHPEAIENNTFVADIEIFHHQVQEFVNSQLVYARQAEDHTLMTTPDDNGQLPLHRALQNNVRLGSIKLLVKGNPAAVLSPNNKGALPLHVAFQYHDPTEVIEYLVGLDPSSLDAMDRDGNTAVHYACRSAKYDSIAMLLEKYGAVSISKRNTHGKLPVELLWESNEVDDRESVEYMGSVFKLLRAYPEMLAMSDRTEQQSNDADSTTVAIFNSEQPVDADATRNGTKRKFGHE
jgi:ankyrin repeat protein